MSDLMVGQSEAFLDGYEKGSNEIKLDLNEPQRETLNRIKGMIPGSHWLNLIVRYEGENYLFEADFLKNLILKIT